MESKAPWLEAPHIWPTKAAFFSFLRGNLRRAVWEKWPLKFEFKNAICSPPPEDYKGRARLGTECALSGVWTGKSAAEVDHIVGNASLRDWEDVLPFIQHLCASKSNMQYVSKEAHKIKSYSEKNGVSYEDASCQKLAIDLIKKKMCKAFISGKGEVPASNEEGRRAQIIKLLKKERVNADTV